MILNDRRAATRRAPAEDGHSPINGGGKWVAVAKGQGVRPFHLPVQKNGILNPMSTKSKIPETDVQPIIERCTGCEVEISTRHTIKEYDAEGKYTGVSISVRMCSACGSDSERRLAARSVDDARRRAEYEKSLADLRARAIQRTGLQGGLDMGLD